MRIDRVKHGPHTPGRLAFMEYGSSEPRHTAKSQTVSILQELFDASGDDTDHFILDCDPVLNEQGVTLAIDGMNYIHCDVDKGYALLDEMHVTDFARRIVSNLCKALGDSLLTLDVHFDDPSLVSISKRGGQERLDDGRNGGLDHIGELGQSQPNVTELVL